MIRKIKCPLGIAFLLFVMVSAVLAQGGNTISGHVFGSQRLPLEGITVELLDDFSRTLARIRTDSTGRFFFSRMPSGRYRIRVLPLGTSYLEQEQDVEIINMVRSDSAGQRIISAYDNVQRDFYLRVDRTANPLSNETVFVQTVPEEAQRLYDQGVGLLKDGKTEEGFEKLKSAIEVFPTYYMAIERLGLEYIGRKYYDAAGALLQKAVEINPRSYKGWYGLAYSLKSLNLDADALRAAKSALGLSPSSIDALLLTGTLLRVTGSYKESQEHLIRAKRSTKTPVPEIFWQLALLYGNNLHQYKEAADELEMFLKYVPENTDTEKVRALIKTFREKSKNT